MIHSNSSPPPQPSGSLCWCLKLQWDENQVAWTNPIYNGTPSPRQRVQDRFSQILQLAWSVVYSYHTRMLFLWNKFRFTCNFKQGPSRRQMLHLKPADATFCSVLKPSLYILIQCVAITRKEQLWILKKLPSPFTILKILLYAFTPSTKSS